MKKYYILFTILAVFCIVCCDPNDSKTDSDPAGNELSDNKSPAQNVRITNVENGTKGRTEPGYEYIHHISNNTEKPKAGDQITYHKIEKKNDSIVLSSTYYKLEPNTALLIPPDSIPQPPNPMYHALFLMSPGDSLTVIQDLDTFPQSKLPKGVTPDDHFTYHVKLLSIKRKAIIDKEIAAIKARHITIADSLKTFIKEYKAGNLDDQLVTTESGLKYFMNKEGDGDKVRDGGFVKVHYIGMLENGKLFDGTFHSAKPYAVRIGRKRVIPGWDEAMPLINKGGEGTFIIPYELAYGVAGKPPGVPERADLFFYISLVDIY